MQPSRSIGTSEITINIANDQRAQALARDLGIGALKFAEVGSESQSFWV